MSSNFTPLKGNCPVCDGEERDCRQSKITGLYHCRTDNPSPNFTYIKHDAINFGMYVETALRSEQNAEKLAEHRRQQKINERIRLDREAKERAQFLSAADRDREIRKILNQLTLTSEHRAELRHRGLSDKQIDNGIFRSVGRYEKLQHPVSINLAGVSADTNGRSLVGKEPGYLCPVWNGDGLIIGWQIRLDNDKDCKYKWPTSRWPKRPNGPTSHQQNGEMPVTVCRPAILNGDIDAIGIVEGILKPKIAAELSGKVFIGAAGGNFASSAKSFKIELDKLSAEFDTKIVRLYADAGSTANPNVMREYRKTHKLVTEWGYELRVAWWGQKEKSAGDIDDILAAGDTDKITDLFWKDFEEIASNKAYRMLRMLDGLKRKVKKAASPIFGASTPVREIETIPYFAGERIETWQKATAKHKFIVDTSGTGTGKSFDSGLCEPERFNADRIIYISKDHRNASTPSLKNWEDLEARHKGLTLDNLGNWRRAKADDRVEVGASCDRTEFSAVMREKNISGSDTANLMCPTCPSFEGCRAGEKFGFLKARTETLKNTRFRSHPDSLPGTQTFGYAPDEEGKGKGKGTVLIWEEWSECLSYSKEIQIKQDDIEHITAELFSADKDAFGLNEWIVRLWEFSAGKHPIDRWGMPHDQVLEILLPLVKGETDIDAISQATNPNEKIQSILHGLDDHGVSLQDLPAHLRKSFAESDEQLAEKAQRIAKQWVVPFLEVLLGRRPGHVSLDNRGTFTLTIANRRLIEIAHAAKSNIFLDATGDIDKFCRILGIDAEDVFCTAQVPTHKSAKLTIKQVIDHGRLGISRGAEQVRAIDAMVAAIREKDSEAAVIDFKKFTSAEPGLNLKWLSESRGSNLAQNAKTLVLVGAPCRPIATLAAEFTLLYGRSPNIETEEVTREVRQIRNVVRQEATVTSRESADQQFRDYIYRDVLAAISQGIGRLRANRREGEELTIYFISNFVLDLPVEVVPALEITLEAATPFQRLEIAIRRAGEELQAKGKKLTLTAIADYCQVTKQRVSQLARELGYATAAHFKKSLVLLVGSLSKTRQNFQEYIPLAAEKQIELWAAQISSLPKSVILALMEWATGLPELSGEFLALVCADAGRSGDTADPGFEDWDLGF